MFMMYWWFFTSVFMDKYGQGEANHILLWVSRIIHWIGFREMSLATSLQLFFKVKKHGFLYMSPGTNPMLNPVPIEVAKNQL